jgi:penicillin-binding protein 1C
VIPAADPVPVRRRRGRRLIRLAALALLLAGLWWGGPRLTPLPEPLAAPPQPPPLVTDRHGRPLFHPLDADGRGRSGEALAAADIPPRLRDALLAAEDRRFFDHDGFDPLAALRASGQNLRHRRVISGASTITMQVVKLRLHRDQPRTLARKARELWLARVLETRMGKPEILAAWLNSADFGNLHRGITRAAAGYFGKRPEDLSLAEAAALVGLPQSPSRLDPYRRPDEVTRRRDWILARMAAAGAISAADHERARNEPAGLRDPASVFAAPHVVAHLWQAAVSPPPGTWRTTIDLDLQTFAESRLRHHLDRLAGRNVTQGAVVVVENASGAIRALVGSRDFRAPAGQVNHAFAARSPGSALKPFTYLMAFENGAGPWTLLADVPGSFATPTGPYQPRNFHDQYAGPVTARHALANSLNLPAVRLLAAHGGPAALHAVMHRAGFTGLARDPARYGLGLTLGNAETRLLDLAAAYACLARGGVFLPPRLLEDAPAAAPLPIFDPAAVWLVTDILCDNQARAESFTLDSPLRLPFPVAAKTGTSTDFRDNWTLGYTPEFTVAVWVGNSDNRPMRRVSGIDGAAPVFHDLMARLHTAAPPRWPPPPSGLVEVTIDPLLGKRVPAGAPRALREWAAAAALPPRAGPDDLLADGRVVLGAEFAPWLAGPHNRRPERFAPAAPDRGVGFQIIFPPPDSEFFLDPTLPDGGRRLVPRSNAPDPGGIVWTSPTLAVASDRREAVITLAPGHPPHRGPPPARWHHPRPVDHRARALKMPRQMRRRIPTDSAAPVDAHVVDLHEGAVDRIGHLAGPRDDRQAQPDRRRAVAEFVFLAAQLAAVEVEDQLVLGPCQPVGVEIPGEVDAGVFLAGMEAAGRARMGAFAVHHGDVGPVVDVGVDLVRVVALVDVDLEALAGSGSGPRSSARRNCSCPSAAA